jgi:hypothetical protein
MPGARRDGRHQRGRAGEGGLAEREQKDIPAAPIRGAFLHRGPEPPRPCDRAADSRYDRASGRAVVERALREEPSRP